MVIKAIMPIKAIAVIFFMVETATTFMSAKIALLFD